jgi:hypothetical protein
MNSPILHWTLVATALAAVAVGGSRWLQGPEPPVTPQRSVAADERTATDPTQVENAVPADREQLLALRRLAHELSALRTQLNRVAQQQVALRQELDGLPEWSGSQSDQVPAGPESAAEVEDRMWQQQTFLEERLSSEKRDDEWAQSTLAQIEEGLQQEELAGIRLVDSACGSTLCQVQLSLDADRSVEEEMQRLSVHRPWDGPTFFAISDDGIASLYFAREGYDLPEIAAPQQTL